MNVCHRRVMFLFAIAALLGVVQSRAVNISNTWMLPEEGFPVFYRYFRDRISWYEADAVCQFHHANLVTADSSSQYDAIRAYLKELDITEKVWIGLSKPQEKPNFLWTDFGILSGEGHWQESLPTGDSQSLCAVMDPASDFLWRALPCGGPEVAAFICELPIPSWALGPKGCLLTELPSLTVLYIPEQSALELTSDCGLDGTKRIACKGNADREEMLRQLTCIISNDDMDDDKSTKTSTSDYFETSTWDDNSLGGKTTKSYWTSNTINAEYEMPTRHRRETEDTLSPVSTKSSFKEVSTTDLSWQDTHQEKVVLTTQHITALDGHVTPTLATNFERDGKSDASTITVGESAAILDSSSSSSTVELEEHTKQTKETAAERPMGTTQQSRFTTVSPKVLAEFTTHLKNGTTNMISVKPKPEPAGGTRSTPIQDGNVEDYASAINQGQLFSIIENGTMFDIIELNETDQEPQPTKSKEPSSDSITTMHLLTKSIKKSTTVSSIKPIISTKKPLTKKLAQPTKRVLKESQNKKQPSGKFLTTTQRPTTNRVQSVDEMEEKLTKEFEMMPDIKDTSLKLTRTFRKELPPTSDEDSSLESGSQFGVPRILNFTITNTLVDSEEERENQRDQPHQETNVTIETLIISDQDEPASSVVKKNEPRLDFDDSTTLGIDNKTQSTPKLNQNVAKKKPEVTENGEVLKPTLLPIDPRLYVLNNHTHHLPQNNHSESVFPSHAQTSTEKSRVTKEDFLPKSLLGEKPMSFDSAVPATATTPHSESSEDGYSEHPFPSDEPKKINRHRSLHNNKGKKFYPYFFSRMLG